MNVRVVAMLIALAGVSGARGEWQVGLATVKITPEEPVMMSGYASRTDPSKGVLQDLYVKALGLSDEEGGKALLITTDLIGFPKAIAEVTCERVKEATGLKREQILISASHTHTGPRLTLTSDGGEIGDRQVAYTKWMMDRVAEAAQSAMANLQTAQLSKGTGLARFVMNRREPTPRGIVLGFNPRGPVDRSVPVLRVSTNGKLLAVVFGAACHNTTFTGKDYELSGDYAGYAQAYLEREHPGIQAMFMMGCGGDANPYPRGTAEAAQQNGEELGSEVSRLLGEKLSEVEGPIRTKLADAALPLQPLPTKAAVREMTLKSGGWRRWVAGQLMELHENGEQLPAHYTTPFAVWQFGDDLTLVGLPGEVVVDYVYLVEKSIGSLNLWIAAYCNDVFGYLPSARVLREGGYETRGLYSGGIGFFAPEAEDVAIETVRKLAQDAGREISE